MAWRLALAAILGALLCGCYQSHQLLLDAKAAVQPVTAGEWRRDKDAVARLRPRRDGAYDVWFGDDAGQWDGPHALWINRLGEVGGRTLYVMAERDSPDKDFTYAVAYVANGEVYEAAPQCDQPAAQAAAKAAGATQDDGKYAPCLFTDRAALFQALRTFAVSADFGAPFVRR